MHTAGADVEGLFGKGMNPDHAQGSMEYLQTCSCPEAGPDATRLGDI